MTILTKTARPKSWHFQAPPVSPKITSNQQQLLFLMAQGMEIGDAMKELQGGKRYAIQDRSCGPNPVTWNGVQYPSRVACARAHGVSDSIMATRMKNAEMQRASQSANP